MSQAALPCIVCDQPMTRVQQDGYEWQANDGLIGEARGNYGSTVFDPITGTVTLFFVICDECMVEKASQGRVLVLTRARDVVAVDPDSDFKHPVVVGFEPLQRQAVPWDPKVDYEEPPLEVEWEDIGTKMGAIEWRVER